jgi:hypothetical protein
MNIASNRLLTIAICSFFISACACQKPILQSPVSGLGEIMAQSSSRHIKLWYAGAAQNWKLAAYEIDELKEGFEDAGKYHPTHKNIKQSLPELLSLYMNPPLEQLEKAISGHNSSEFKSAYTSLTTACNACHQATDFGFNKIRQPDINPYSNQAF